MMDSFLDYNSYSIVLEKKPLKNEMNFEISSLKTIKMRKKAVKLSIPILAENNVMDDT